MYVPRDNLLVKGGPMKVLHQGFPALTPRPPRPAYPVDIGRCPGTARVDGSLHPGTPPEIFIGYCTL